MVHEAPIKAQHSTADAASSSSGSSFSSAPRTHNTANDDAAALLLRRIVESERYRVTTKHTGLNLRSLPMKGSNIIGSLPRGSLVEGGSIRDGYVQVTACGKSGWACARYLTANDEPPTLEEIDEQDDHEEHAPPRVAPHVDEPQSADPLRERVGEPFVKGEGDAHDIDPNDVKQGKLGDCWLLAGEASVARANPEAIRKLIKDNGDGTYDVTLYISEHVWKEKTPHVIRVDSKFPLSKAASPGDTGPKGEELWPLLLEKAYAQYKGRYIGWLGGYVGGIEGGTDGSGMDLLLPQSSKVYYTSMYTEAQMMSQITQALLERRPVTAGTSKTVVPSAARLEDLLGVYDSHEYAVKSTNPGENTISLQNPWGNTHLENLAMQDFNRFYLTYAIGPKL